MTTLSMAVGIVLVMLGFIGLLLMLSRIFWPDTHDDYETLEWDDDVKGQLSD